jgi:hypothetical protein
MNGKIYDIRLFSSPDDGYKPQEFRLLAKAAFDNVRASVIQDCGQSMGCHALSGVV